MSDEPDSELDLETIDLESIGSSGIESVDGSVVDPDNYDDTELLEERLGVAHQLLIVAQEIASTTERALADTGDDTEAAPDAHRRMLLALGQQADELRGRYHRLLIVEVLRHRLRAADTVPGFPPGTVEDFPESADWDVLDRFVAKLVAMAAYHGPEEALDHLERRIGEGPIRAVDPSAVALISKSVDLPDDIDLTEEIGVSLEASEIQADIVESMRELDDVELEAIDGLALDEDLTIDTDDGN